MATGPMGVSGRPKPKVPVPQKPTTGAPTPPGGPAGGDMTLEGRGGRKFNVPGSVWSAVPEVERAGLMDAFRRQGIGGLKNASTGKPWANDLAQAVAGARGAVQNKPGARPPADVAPKVATPPAAVPPGPDGAPEPVKPAGGDIVPVGPPGQVAPSPVAATPPTGAPDTNPRGVPEPAAGGAAGGGAVGGGAQSPFLTMQGGKGGYSVDEWNGLKAFIATQPAAVQQQIMAGIDAVPGERGQKFDYLLGQIKKFAGGAGGVPSSGDGGGVPGMPSGPAPRPDANVPAGGITNNWRPSDPAWVASIEQKFGPGTVQKVQQEMSAAVANLPEGTGARRAAIYGILQKYGLAQGGMPAETNPRLPASQTGGVPITPGSPDGTPIPTPGGGLNQGVVPTYTPPPLTQAPPPVQTQPPAQTLPDIFIPF